ncbi:Tfp pilus assembly protein, PilE [Desulfosarcina cetonica]|uniref:tetratricopeptide repeat protein n=1 Tax=Desulfosarcina cetonica TaxID=90730 RepID=UPI0006D1EBA9|nr:tetratricopeptide repeat protein [Desulfosarcina cetonica]VTR64700.1 Tfp pilus assembly protein, PilE [Desulfosarcina cetonica]
MSNRDDRFKLTPPLCSLILLWFVLVVYSNTFDASWHMDDIPNIVNNRPLHIDNLMPRTLWQAFFAKPGHSGTYYRPIPCLTFALNWYFGQNNPWGYHLVNIVIHGLTAIVIYLVVLQLFQTPALVCRYEHHTFQSVALLCALLWAVHPLQTQAVTYIVQRMAQLAALFYLTGMLWYVKGRLSRTQKERWLYLAGCGFCGVLGVMSKENAAMLPVSLMLVEVCFFQQGPLKIKTRYLVLATCGVASLVYILGIYLFMGGDYLFFLKGYSTRSYTPLQRLFTEARILWLYLSQLALPLPGRLSIEHDVVVSTSLFSPWTTLPAAMGIVAMIGAALAGIRKFPAVAFGVLFFFLNHLVESSVIGLELTFEHRNYLPDVFLFLPLAIGIQSWLARIQSRGHKSRLTAAKALVALVVLSLGTGTYIRNRTWQTNDTLWLDALTKAPNSARALNTLAIRLAWAPHATAQQMNKAIELFQRSLSGNKSRTLVDADIYGNIANVYSKKGEYIKAMGYFDKAIDADPGNLKVRADKAFCMIKMGAYTQAYEITRHLIEKAPDRFRYLNTAGFILLWLESPQDALVFLQKALRIAPYESKVLLNIGAAMKMLGHYSQADWFFKRAIQRDHNNVWPYLFLIENQIEAGNRSMALGYLIRTINAFSVDAVDNAFKTQKEILPPFSRHVIESAIRDLKRIENRIHQDAVPLLNQQP